MPEISRDEFNRLYDAIKDGFKGTHERLDDLNGRTRVNETEIAVLKATQAPGTPFQKSKTAAYGVGGGAVLLGLFEAIKAFFQ